MAVRRPSRLSRMCVRMARVRPCQRSRGGRGSRGERERGPDEQGRGAARGVDGGRGGVRSGLARRPGAPRDRTDGSRIPPRRLERSRRRSVLGFDRSRGQGHRGPGRSRPAALGEAHGSTPIRGQRPCTHIAHLRHHGAAAPREGTVALRPLPARDGSRPRSPTWRSRMAHGRPRLLPRELGE